jgi:hypothetical protein
MAWYDRTNDVAPSQALADAVATLEARAVRTEPRPVHLRTASADGAAWIDLGGADSRALRVSPDGWELVGEPVPVLFRRTALSAPLVSPARGGSLEPLWRHVNVTPKDRPLVLAVLVSALVFPDQPQPILALGGEPGAGKSSAARRLAALVDPASVGLTGPPGDQDAWLLRADGSWVVVLDNLSGMPPWLTDALCRCSTGDGIIKRKLYSDGDLVVTVLRRCVILTSVDLGALRADLNERVVSVRLDRIPDERRAEETALNAAWDQDAPLVFGALLDLASKVMALRADGSNARPAVLPRMADFGRVLECVDAAMGTDGLGAYLGRASDLAADTVTARPFLDALRAEGRPFEGSAAELLAAVTPQDQAWRKPRTWPRDARAVTRELRGNAGALRKLGWQVDELPRGGRDKCVRWVLVPPRGCAVCGCEVDAELWAAGERQHAAC